MPEMVWIVRSGRSSVDKHYRITCLDGDWHCDCQGFPTAKKNGRVCRHVRICNRALSEGMRAMYHEET
jgi:hypothetical protein